MHGWVQSMSVHPQFHWARANGWAVMTMVELLEVLPKNHPGYAGVLAQLQAHINGLIKYQDGTGFWHQLIDKNVSEILNLHEYAGAFVGKPISIFHSIDIARALSEIQLPPSKLDLGKLTYEFGIEEDKYPNARYFVMEKLKKAKSSKEIKPKDVVLYGFGRIGRLLARELVSKTGKGDQLRLRAIVVREKNDAITLEKRASLLRYDSIHGDFMGSVVADAENNALIINGTTVHVISASSPEEIDYTKWNIKNALVIDNTGAFTTQEALSRHLKSKGAHKVLLTAPGKGIPNIVHGVNQNEYNPDEIDIFSAASCTTNAIVPALKVLNDAFEVKHGHVETVHSYTNDQNLIDNFHKGDRRGRSAAMNMVITETGAAKAVAKALPELEGKLSGNAIRVPTPDVSMAILNLTLNKAVDRDTVNKVLRDASLKSNLRNQIDYIESPEVVSTDFVGSNRAGIVDGLATIANGKNIILYVWYDNEYGYSHQVVRVIQELAGLHPPKFPSR